MTDNTKIALSETELDKVQDSDWILTKHRIIEKVYQLLNLQVPVIRYSFFEQGLLFPEEVQYSVPKITKGENYLHLPYVILDYPAVFAREHIFAVRTMFWWGNFFSVTLLLKGTYKEMYAAKIASNLQRYPDDIFVCVNENEWEHHFASNNYKPAGDCSPEELSGNSFLKIAVKYELKDWNRMPQLLGEAYLRIAGLVDGS